MKRKFWNWIKKQNQGGSEMRTLFLNGSISDESWFGDEVTPKLFKDELAAGDGPIRIWINSPGGNVFAAAQIYNMLMDYPNDVTVMIDGLAASAASVIAMAGTEVQMSPVAMMMIHNPATVAIGDSEEMKKTVKMLDEVKESIMNAYEIKTGLPRDKIFSYPTQYPIRVLSKIVESLRIISPKLLTIASYCDILINGITSFALPHPVHLCLLFWQHQVHLVEHKFFHFLNVLE